MAKKEPSMNLMKRMGELAPDKVVNELEATRRDRDALKQALAIRITDYLKTLTLNPNDVLILKPPASNPNVSIKSLTEIAMMVTDRLKARAGWEGVLLIEAGACLKRMPQEEEELFYRTLKKKHGDD